MVYQIFEITDTDGNIVEQDWLERAEHVHRQLRPHLSREYKVQMSRVFAGGGRMVIAVDRDEVMGIAVYRQHENTFDGLHCYVDDLVTDEALRSRKVGQSLLAWLESAAREAGCKRLKLDSGTQRGRAHQFYFREGMQIASFHFYKDLD